MKEKCIFCKFVKKPEMVKIVYENKESLAFLDIRPASRNGGHTLVIPKKHYITLSEIPKKELNSLIDAVQKVTKAVVKFSEGANVLQNNGKVAGQYIMHAHFHIIPRYKNDNIEIEKWDSHDYKDGEMTETMEKLKKLIEKN